MRSSILTAVSALALSFGARAATPYEVQTPPLDTEWTYKVGTDPWPEHPRPQLKREAWKSLNGIWTYQSAGGGDDVDSPPESGELKHEVLIPSCIESGLSGIQETDVRYMWFATTFEVPEDWEEDVILLNFEGKLLSPCNARPDSDHVQLSIITLLSL